jgi:hypothetical protein
VYGEANKFVDDLWLRELAREKAKSGTGGNKLRTYVLFKKERCFEPHIMHHCILGMGVSEPCIRVFVLVFHHCALRQAGMKHVVVVLDAVSLWKIVYVCAVTAG